MAASAPFSQRTIAGSLAAAAALAWFALATAAFGFVSPDDGQRDRGQAAHADSPQPAGQPVRCCSWPDGSADGAVPSQPASLEEAGLMLGPLAERRWGLLRPRDPSSVWSGQSVLTLGRQARDDRLLDVVLGSPTPSRLQARAHRFAHSDGSLALRGSVLDVGPRFTPSADVPDGGAEEAMLLEEHVGKKALALSGEWRLAPGLSLNTSQDRTRANDRLDEQYGLTTTNAEHSLALDVGPKGRLRAALSTRREEWDRWLGKREKERSERRLEFDTPLGGTGAGKFAFALAAVDSAEGAERQRERTAEAHLSLAPSGRLRLTADYLSKAEGDGGEEMTKAVGGALQLAPGTEVSATLKRLSSAGGDTDEAGLRLAAKLGCGSLELGQGLTRGSEGPVRSRTYSFDGGFGRGGARASLKAQLRETRADGPEGKLEREGGLSLGRSFGAGLKLSLNHRGKVSGSNAEAAQEAETSCELAGDLGGRADFVANVATGRNAAGDVFSRHRVSLSGEWHSARASLEHSTWREGVGRGSVVTCGIDIPAGDLPEWAKSIATVHQFSDAAEYLIPEEPVWGKPDMSFGGYRLWAARRVGGEDDGRETFGFAHRRVVGGRYHLLAAFEEGPEATSGQAKGHPLSLRRYTVEVGAPIARGLTARCGYGMDAGIAAPDDRVDRAGLGVWGRLAGGDQVEVDISHESGRWDDEARERTSVTLLYSKSVGEDHQVELKVGYAWGENVGDGRSRDSRLTLGYEKPL